MRSLVEKAKTQKEVNFSSSILDKDEKNNIFMGDIYENINVCDFINYNFDNDASPLTLKPSSEGYIKSMNIVIIY